MSQDQLPCFLILFPVFTDRQRSGFKSSLPVFLIPSCAPSRPQLSRSAIHVPSNPDASCTSFFLPHALILRSAQKAFFPHKAWTKKARRTSGKTGLTFRNARSFACLVPRSLPACQTGGKKAKLSAPIQWNCIAPCLACPYTNCPGTVLCQCMAGACESHGAVFLIQCSACSGSFLHRAFVVTNAMYSVYSARIAPTCSHSPPKSRFCALF